MADDELTIDDQISPEEEMDRTLDTIRRMREEEAALTATRMPTTPAPAAPPPPQTFEQTMAFQPTLAPDLSRAPGVPSPAPVLPPSRTVYTGQPREVPMTAAVEGPVDMRSLMLMRQYESQQGYQSHIRTAIAQGKDPQQAQSEALAIFGPGMFPTSTGRGFVDAQRLQNFSGVGYSWNPFTGIATPKTPERPRFRSTPQDDIRRAILNSKLTTLNSREKVATSAKLAAQTPEEIANLNRELNSIRREREALEKEYAIEPSAPATQPQRVVSPTGTTVARTASPAAGTKRRGGPKEKLARAQELELQYPDASKADIMDMLKMEFD